MTAQTLGFIGFGNLAKTLYHGFKDDLFKHNIRLLINSRSSSANTSDLPDYVSKNTVLADSDVIVIAVKPQQLSSIMPELTAINWTNKCLVSLLAGVSLTTFKQTLPGLTHAFRVMPNTAAQFKQSMTTYSCLETTHSDYEMFITSLFYSLGSIVKIDESNMDFSTALCGSGPAFLFQLFQDMIELAEAEGFSTQQARLMINQIVTGVADSLNNRSEAIPTLIKEICSPKGTTEAGLDSYQTNKLSDIWKTVFQTAKNRSEELSKNF